jgi:hypothetical protein
VNGCTLPSGLAGTPVGMAANALRTHGFKPCFQASPPKVVKMPHLTRSRRVICPCESALTISRRFPRACSASLSRPLDDFCGKYMDTSLCVTPSSSRMPRATTLPAHDKDKGPSASTSAARLSPLLRRGHVQDAAISGRALHGSPPALWRAVTLRPSNALSRNVSPHEGHAV